jgi:nickel superoxide dismutase
MAPIMKRNERTTYATEAVYAHCDIPCGIYDPHEAQIAALTVLRMVQLSQDLKEPGPNAKPEEKLAYQSKLSRITATKEAHAERVKHEVRVIVGDYFTADLMKQFPEVMELNMKILKQASKARQEFSLESANDLLDSVQQFAELFWKTKNVATKRAPSHQKSGGELVIPA